MDLIFEPPSGAHRMGIRSGPGTSKGREGIGPLAGGSLQKDSRNRSTVLVKGKEWPAD